MPVRRCQRLRKRIGRVSLYLHHGAWWLYYRDGTQAIRRRVSTDRGEAERIAAEVNAQVAAAAPTMFAFAPTNVVELRQRFLNYHEDVLKSSVATINRYRTATQHLIDYAAGLGPKIKVHEIPIAEFVAFLRKRQVSPNGHRNTAKRLLRGNPGWPRVGIFAQRAKDRPNRLGVSRCSLLKVDGRDLHVRGLDAVAGTPVLDVKPWMDEFGPDGPTHQPQWSRELMCGYWRAT